MPAERNSIIRGSVVRSAAANGRTEKQIGEQLERKANLKFANCEMEKEALNIIRKSVKNKGVLKPVEDITNQEFTSFRANNRFRKIQDQKKRLPADNEEIDRILMDLNKKKVLDKFDAGIPGLLERGYTEEQIIMLKTRAKELIRASEVPEEAIDRNNGMIKIGNKVVADAIKVKPFRSGQAGTISINPKTGEQREALMREMKKQEILNNYRLELSKALGKKTRKEISEAELAKNIEIIIAKINKAMEKQGV